MSSLPREEFSAPLLQRSRERPPHSKPAQHLLLRGRRTVTSNQAPILYFLVLALHRHAFASEAFESLMGCKQYARMLGLSRGYPHILYLSLSKWDAAPLIRLFHNLVHTFSFTRNSVARNLRATPKQPLFRIFPGTDRSLHRTAHASISARATVRRFRSEMGRVRVADAGHFSTANPIATYTSSKISRGAILCEPSEDSTR